MASEQIALEIEPDVQFGLAVRARRAQLAITLDQLAQSCGVTAGALSKVERGLLSVSLRNAVAIAEGLGCSLSDLLQTTTAVQVTRAGEHARFSHTETGIVRQALARPAPGIELLHYDVPVGQQSSHFAAHRSGTREMFYILSGQVRVWMGSESVLLAAGDTALLAMDIEHHFANEGQERARLVLLVVQGR